MENKNNTALFTLGGIVIGIFIGFLIWGIGYQGGMMSTRSGHMMPDGSMMDGEQSMDAMMENMNMGLTGKTGDVFDQTFLSEMIVHHQGAIDMAKLALTNAKHQEIKDLANAIIKAQTSEISEMKSWQKLWYGVTQ